MFNNTLGFLGTDTFDQTRTQIPCNALFRSGKTLSKTRYMQLPTISWVFLPLTLDRQELPNMNAGENSNNRCKIITEESPTIIGAKARNCIMVILIAKNDAL